MINNINALIRKKATIRYFSIQSDKVKINYFTAESVHFFVDETARFRDVIFSINFEL